jgi:pilus assembly protein CpaC
MRTGQAGAPALRISPEAEYPYTATRREPRRKSLSALVRAVGLAIALSVCGAATGDALAASEKYAFDKLLLTQHKSRTLEIPAPFTLAVVGAPDIADTLPMSDRVLYIQGKKVGTTNISIFGPNKELIGIIDVEVSVDIPLVAKVIGTNLPHSKISVSGAGDQIVLGGLARDAVEAEQAMALAKGAAREANVINIMKIAQAQQVLLKVRFLEASRTAGRDLGVNLFAANRKLTSGINTGGSALNPNDSVGIPLVQTIATFAGTSATPYVTGLAHVGGNVDVLISALESKGLLRSLAEPDLIALSGDKASFLAGGEIPVPVLQSNNGSSQNLTVEWKPFGVQLTFQPTVLANGVINLRLMPSVSELNYTNAIQNQNFVIPAISKREAQTTIELRDGQSFAIAGLLQAEGLRNVNQVPWLGSVPVLGTLFRSSSYQQKETDLVVLVTPHLVAPMAPGKHIATPLDKTMPSNDRDFFLNGQTELNKKYQGAGGRDEEAPYGHIIAVGRK